MLIKGEIPMLVSWTSTGKRVGDPNQSLIVDKAGYGVIPVIWSMARLSVLYRIRGTLSGALEIFRK